MNDQLKRLSVVPAFEPHMSDPEAAYTDVITTMQVNVGLQCNQACKHCHVKGGPDRTEAMSREVMECCLDVFRNDENLTTIDITGGAPEMNPEFRWFLKECCKLADTVYVRTNLTILEQPGYEDLPELYRDLGVTVFASLPYYREKDADRQRGKGVFQSSIKMLQKLNSLGIGEPGGPDLNLVYNPGGAFLPPDQESMGELYHQKLEKDFGIHFSNLFAITNNPVGRFGDFLERSGNLERYMNTLFDAYNPASEPAMMCRYQISVGYDGRIFDCDFNQAVDLPVITKETIFDLREHGIQKRHIALANHCYGCTAGQGSSCGGATS